MRNLSLVFLALISGCFYGPPPGPAPTPGPAPNTDGTLTIDNFSSYVLIDIRVTAVNSRTWGPNLLGGDILYPDEQLTVAVACNDYDVLIADEYDRECILSNLDLCLSNQTWVIDDTTLGSCGF